MKRVLIVIYDMRIGGAQKSLLSFLQTLAQDERCSKYQIDLMPFNPTGEFLLQIPEGINIKQPPRILRWMGTKMSKDLLFRHFSLSGFLGECMWVLRKKLRLLYEHGNVQQKLWQVWHTFIPVLKDEYDVAISYIDGTASYYVMDKVNAGKKVLWLHTDYQKMGYDAGLDARFFRECDAIATISAECREVLRSVLPELGEKIHVIENITSADTVTAMALEGSCPEYPAEPCLRLLTVGRLHHLKGLDMAVDAAKALRDAGIAFRWLVVGEGGERKVLEEQIHVSGLDSCFCLIGSRNNPYQYMRECDILVQTSRCEGKSIVLDEAKILGKPIVVTSYPTVYDAVEHEETGLIVDMNVDSICQGILRMATDDALRKRIVSNLQKIPKGNEKELSRYIDIMF